MSKKNIFLFSPGGYGPYVPNLHFWGDCIEGDENGTDEESDKWIDASHDYIDEHRYDVDYGIYFMSRKGIEELIESLKKLLEE